VHFGKIKYFFKVLKMDFSILYQYFFNTFNTVQEPWSMYITINNTLNHLHFHLNSQDVDSRYCKQKQKPVIDFRFDE